MSEIKIRKATLDDIEQMVELGTEMHLESEYVRYSFDPIKVAKTLTGVIEDKNGIAIVAERDGSILGGMIGYVTSHYFGNDLVASDLAVFVTSEERKGRLALKLIYSFIEQAKSLGANHISLANSTGVESDRIKALYERIGFKHVGYVFQMGV